MAAHALELRLPLISQRPALHLLFACFVYFAVALSGFAQQASPRLIPFQGRLTDQQGNPYTNGQFTVVFRLYSQAVGGTPLNDWVERHQSVGVINGMINVFLGSITSLDPVDFSQVVHLGITIDADNNPATSDPEMMPRQMIIPAFWAKNAEKLAGQDWTPIFGVNSPLGELPASKIQTQGITTDRIATNAITTDKIAPGAIQTSDIGDGQITVEKLAPSFQLDTVIPPGTIQAFGGPNPPNGWLLCDGRPLYATNYPQLFAAIGTAWGGGYTNGVPQGNFNLPDLRGRFLRGVSGETTRDPDRNLRTATQLGGNVGNVVGSDQGDATRRPNSEFTTSTDGAHTHLLERASSGTQIRWGDGGGYSSNAIDAGDGVSEGTSGVPRARSAGSHSHTISGGGDLETRPKNAYVHFIIKY